MGRVIFSARLQRGVILHFSSPALLLLSAIAERHSAQLSATFQALAATVTVIVTAYTVTFMPAVDLSYETRRDDGLKDTEQDHLMETGVRRHMIRVGNIEGTVGRGGVVLWQRNTRPHQI